MTAPTDYVVPPRSWADVGRQADNLRQRLGLKDVVRVPVIEVIERVLDQHLGLLHFVIGSRKEMSNAEGYTCPNGTFIMLREDVYASVCNGEGRGRFTSAHELGHWTMHTNISLARARPGDGIEAFRLAEPQANQFAAEFLMPSCFVDAADDVDDLIERFGVSRGAAHHRLRYLRKRRGT